MSQSVLLVGCGNMGFALLQGWMRQTPAPALHVVEPDEALRERAATAGALAVCDVASLPPDYTPDMIVLAVKPQVIAAVLPNYGRWAGDKTVFLSVAAGIGIAIIEQALGRPTPVMRCMPNTPASIGAGVMAVCANGHVSRAQAAFANRLLAAGGIVVEITDERMMDGVTAISGSGPAYLFLFIEALAAAAVKIGLPEPVAGQMALQTIYGAAMLAAQSGEPAEALRRKVTSKGGTTAAALGVLMEGNALSSLLADAVRAAWQRAVELGK
jgi:pyrroline-5-carboxylate reductase